MPPEEDQEKTELEVFNFREKAIAPQSTVGKALGYILRRQETLEEEIKERQEESEGNHALIELVRLLLGDADDVTAFMADASKKFSSQARARKAYLKKLVE